MKEVDEIDGEYRREAEDGKSRSRASKRCCSSLFGVLWGRVGRSDKFEVEARGLRSLGGVDDVTEAEPSFGMFTRGKGGFGSSQRWYPQERRGKRVGHYKYMELKRLRGHKRVNKRCTGLDTREGERVERMARSQMLKPAVLFNSVISPPTTQSPPIPLVVEQKRGVCLQYDPGLAFIRLMKASSRMSDVFWLTHRALGMIRCYFRYADCGIPIKTKTPR